MLNRCNDAPAQDAIVEHKEHLHVIPLYDLREHTPTTACWCTPTPDEDEPMVYIHHSADGREAFEEGRRLPS